MGLIAREIEGRGVPTLAMSSAWSITAAVRPPRSVFLDFPLGHTAGKPNDAPTNIAIMNAALGAFETMTKPESFVTLPFEWAEDDAWKDAVMRPRDATAGHSDQRVERTATPQYQTDEDRSRAEVRLAQGGCASCIFLE
ncbi:MAG: hypothetical protein HC809_10440 [Gammaproteobacteria bacterium]|nr:hypothetical protein [Gammaproteobacteria bacterium]